MTKEQLEILESMKTMGTFRTKYSNSEVSKVVSELIDHYESGIHKAEWVLDPDNKYFHCSRCKNGGVDLYNGQVVDYCPKCGAYMHLLSEKDKCKDCSDKTYACAFACIKDTD